MSRSYDAGWFRECLQKSGKTQADLTRHLKADKATVSNFFKGTRRLKLEEIEPVARFLEVSIIDVLTHLGIELDSVTTSTDISATLAKHDLTEFLEINVRRSGDGVLDRIQRPRGVETLGEVALMDLDVDESIWCVPTDFAKSTLRVRSADARLIEVIGDSMEPTMRTGDRVLIDLSMTSPSPPGVFAIYDGYGLVVKRIEIVLNSSPAMLRIMSDNDKHETVLVPLDKTMIIGRVAWLGRQM